MGILDLLSYKDELCSDLCKPGLNLSPEVHCSGPFAFLIPCLPSLISEDKHHLGKP